jgi:FBP C-terminal treble-clef zinc-finger
MIPLTEKSIRTAFVNASLRERNSLVLPSDLDATDWSSIDYLGWRDAKAPMIGHVVTELDGVPTGILLRRTEARTRARAQCSWCADVTLPNDVAFSSAKRAGRAGRNGDTVGTLICTEFECSANVRRLPPPAYLGFDVEAARQRRIETLRERVTDFVRSIRDSD